MKVAFNVLILSTTLALSGCSLLTDMVMSSVAKKEPLVGVDTEIVAGDKQQGVDTSTSTKMDDVELNDNAQQNNTSIGKKTAVSGNTEHLTLNEGVEFWQVGVAGMALLIVGMLLGLFLPQVHIKRKVRL